MTTQEIQPRKAVRHGDRRTAIGGRKIHVSQGIGKTELAKFILAEVLEKDGVFSIA